MRRIAAVRGTTIEPPRLPIPAIAGAREQRRGRGARRHCCQRCANGASANSAAGACAVTLGNGWRSRGLAGLRHRRRQLAHNK
jgi:hypothetical protein